MNAFNILLTAAVLSWLAILVYQRLRAGKKAANPRPLTVLDGLVEKKFNDTSDARNAYPAIFLRLDDGSRRTLRLKTWAMQEELYEGDYIRVRCREQWVEDLQIHRRGELYLAAQTPRSTGAVFQRSFVNNSSLFRHAVCLEFVTDEGETVILGCPTGWTLPKKNTRGMLRWHGTTLDNWNEP